MKYQVPQFIGIEDKIFGPLTFKQFAYVGGSLALAFLAYKLLPIYLAIFIIIPALALGTALAFYKINEKPFIEVLESAFRFYGGGRLYVWKKEDKKPEASTISLSDISPTVNLPKLSENKLRDLTWSLDINESLYSQEENAQRSQARDAANPLNLEI
jgi:hypothetical protein